MTTPTSHAMVNEAVVDFYQMCELEQEGGLGAPSHRTQCAPRVPGFVIDEYWASMPPGTRAIPASASRTSRGPSSPAPTYPEDAEAVTNSSPLEPRSGQLADGARLRA